MLLKNLQIEKLHPLELRSDEAAGICYFLGSKIKKWKIVIGKAMTFKEVYSKTLLYGDYYITDSYNEVLEFKNACKDFAFLENYFIEPFFINYLEFKSKNTILINDSIIDIIKEKNNIPYVDLYQDQKVHKNIIFGEAYLKLKEKYGNRQEKTNSIFDRPNKLS